MKPEFTGSKYNKVFASYNKVEHSLEYYASRVGLPKTDQATRIYLGTTLVLGKTGTAWIESVSANTQKA